MIDGIFYAGAGRIGTVMRFAGEPPRTRWQAYASNDRRKGFPTKTQAIAWLVELHESEADCPAEKAENTPRT